MPTIVFVEGFRVMVYPIDHAPAHVHVLKAGLFVRLELDGIRAMGDETMRAADVRKAKAIVTAHLDLCWDAWRRLHG